MGLDRSGRTGQPACQDEGGPVPAEDQEEPGHLPSRRAGAAELAATEAGHVAEGEEDEEA